MEPIKLANFSWKNAYKPIPNYTLYHIQFFVSIPLFISIFNPLSNNASDGFLVPNRKLPVLEYVPCLISDSICFFFVFVAPNRDAIAVVLVNFRRKLDWDLFYGAKRQEKGGRTWRIYSSHFLPFFLGFIF